MNISHLRLLDAKPYDKEGDFGKDFFRFKLHSLYMFSMRRQSLYFIVITITIKSSSNGDYHHFIGR